MPRSRRPVTSSGWWFSASYSRLNRFIPPAYSARKFLAKVPSWISVSTRRISALVASVMMRGPVTRSPHSAVLLMLYRM